MAATVLTGRNADAPMIDMNTTPLIDVMLVLLIMFIITIPLQSHAVKLDLPGGPPPNIEILELKNQVSVGPEGVAAWNGTPVTDGELRALIAAALDLPAEPETHFVPDAEARYERVDQLLALMRKSGVTRLGFVGNERHAAAF